MSGRLKLVLASGSPRRLQLLSQIGVEPNRLCPVTIDEAPKKSELPRNLAKRLAREKAEAALAALKGESDYAGALIIADDLAVAPEALASYVGYVRAAGSGYVSVEVPLGDRLEISVRAA